MLKLESFARKNCSLAWPSQLKHKAFYDPRRLGTNLRMRRKCQKLEFLVGELLVHALTVEAEECLKP